MQRFQRSFNAFIEQFQERWETQPAFRTTWSVLGVGTFMIILCLGAMIGSNLLTGLFASAGNAQHGSVVVAVNNDTTAFPMNKPTPQGTDASGSTPIPVATTTYSPSPTATVTPSQPTAVPSPTDTGTPDPNAFTVTASPQGTWKAGQNAGIQDIATTPPLANATMTITMQFGANPGCMLTPALTVQLDGNGAYHNHKQFIVPACATPGPVTVTYQVPGHPDYSDSTTFTTS
jgi:hypothetical protein